MKDFARRVEATVAGLLTIAALWLHYLSAMSDGGLWRDEANTVGLATLPHVVDVWKNLQFDSFPIVWIAVVRGFAAIFGPMNDPAFRIFGAFIGISLLAALWLHGRVLGRRFSVIALALVALSPSVIRWGNSTRAYGLGMTLIVLTSALVWRFVEKPSRGRFLAAGVLAVLSVQTLYYNSVLLLAICAAAVVVCAFRREARSALLIFAMGAIAALSLIPYVAVIGRASDWNVLVRIPEYTVEWFWLRLFEAMTPAGAWAFFAWCILLVVAALVGLIAVVSPRVLAMSRAERETAIYGLVLLVVGTLGSFIFLRVLRYYTQPWYYLTLMLVAGLAIDVLLGVFAAGRMRVGISLVAFAVGMSTLSRAPAFVATRMTNADLVSSWLENVAGNRDLIVVNPWYEGVSFDRYYRGRAQWMSVPSIPFHRFHRYDLVMKLDNPERFSEADSVVLKAVEQTLTAGNTVYVVGLYPEARPDTEAAAASATSKAPAPVPSAAGQATQSQWPLNLGDLLRRHAGAVVPVTVPSALPISHYESMTVSAVRGWRQ